MPTTDLRRDDIIAEVGGGGTHYGIVLTTGRIMFEVLWLDGGSTTRYRHEWDREIRAIPEDELREARAFRGFDPVLQVRSEAAKARKERRVGAGIRRGGGL